MTSNLQYWEKFDKPPRQALKEIAAGRMKGKTDINPQWRYKAMTETFGPVGIGWKFAIDRKWTEAGANGETMSFVDVSVYVKVDGVWSDAIPGTGGSTLVSKESGGMHNDDDAYKKALTDALSVSLKMLGVGAEIYAGGWDGAKYKEQSSQPEQRGPGAPVVNPIEKVTVMSVMAAKWASPEKNAQALIDVLGLDGMTMQDATKLYNIYRSWRTDAKLEAKAAAEKARAGEVYNPQKDGG